MPRLGVGRVAGGDLSCKTLIGPSSKYLAEPAFRLISSLYRQIFDTATLHANGLWIKRQQLKNIIRHIGADRQAKRLRGGGPDWIIVRPRTAGEFVVWRHS